MSARDHVANTLQLVAFDPDGEPSRRRVPLSELNERERDVAQGLIDARLLVSEQREDDVVVEIAHEALLRGWPPLREAILAHWALLRFLDELDRHARDWDVHDRIASYLWRGERLTAAHDLFSAASASGLTMPDRDRDFYRASEVLDRHVQAEVARHRRRALASAIVALILISAAFLAGLWV